MKYNTTYLFISAGNAIGGNANSIGNNNAAMFNQIGKWMDVMAKMEQGGKDPGQAKHAKGSRQLAGEQYVILSLQFLFPLIFILYGLS